MQLVQYVISSTYAVLTCVAMVFCPILKYITHFIKIAIEAPISYTNMAAVFLRFLRSTMTMITTSIIAITTMSVRIIASFPGHAYVAPGFDCLQSAKTDGGGLVLSPDPTLS